MPTEIHKAVREFHQAIERLMYGIKYPPRWRTIWQWDRFIFSARSTALIAFRRLRKFDGMTSYHAQIGCFVFSYYV